MRYSPLLAADHLQTWTEEYLRLVDYLVERRADTSILRDAVRDNIEKLQIRLLAIEARDCYRIDNLCGDN